MVLSLTITGLPPSAAAGGALTFPGGRFFTTDEDERARHAVFCGTGASFAASDRGRSSIQEAFA